MPWDTVRRANSPITEQTWWAGWLQRDEDGGLDSSALLNRLVWKFSGTRERFGTFDDVAMHARYRGDKRCGRRGNGRVPGSLPILNAHCGACDWTRHAGQFEFRSMLVLG